VFAARALPPLRNPFCSGASDALQIPQLDLTGCFTVKEIYGKRSKGQKKEKGREVKAGPDLGGPRAPGLPPKGGLPPNPSIFISRSL